MIRNRYYIKDLMWLLIIIIISVCSEDNKVSEKEIVCKSDQECSDGKVCILGKCEVASARVCKPQMKRCNGLIVEVCTDDGSQWVYSKSCSNACQNGECTTPICKPGEKKCEGDDVVRCNNNGMWYDFLYHCESGCENADCIEPVCKPFSTRCNNNVVETCNARGTGWLKSEECSEFCEDGKCMYSGPGECSQVGSVRCRGNNIEICSSNRSWEFQETCFVGCMNGKCINCLPGERKCNENDVEICNSDGSGFEKKETCANTCINGLCTKCIPGDRRCNNSSVEVCNSDGQGWTVISNCLTSCVNGQCTNPICNPSSKRCNGNIAQICNYNGTEWEDIETCAAGCSNGQCISAMICKPNEKRCNEKNVEICNLDGSGWVFYEACLDKCMSGECIGAGCVKFSINASPDKILNDALSSALIYSSRITNMKGDYITDGKEFTVEVTGGTIMSSDANPYKEGTQIISINGRIDFVLASSTKEGTYDIVVYASANKDCMGKGSITFAKDGATSFAEDFTKTTYVDLQNTNAGINKYAGSAQALLTDSGTGKDGALIVNDIYNINVNNAPGREFIPDSVTYNISTIKSNSVILSSGGGLETGDEVILIQMTGANGGLYEFLTIDNVSGNEVFFSQSIKNTYNVREKVVLQRVPQYTEVVINGVLTANEWNGNVGGLLVFKANKRVVVNNNGLIDMKEKGYRSGEGYGGAKDKYCNLSTPPTYGASAGYATKGLDCITQCSYPSSGGLAYGDVELSKLFLGSGGGGASCPGYSGVGGRGGGMIIIISPEILVSGKISADGGSGTGGGCAYGGGGSGGTIWLIAGNIYSGVSNITATGGTDYRKGADGRIRFDYYRLSGDSVPPAYKNTITLGNVYQSTEIDSTYRNINFATLLTILEEEKEGFEYEISNDSGINWVKATPGKPVTFPNIGSDLRLRVKFPIGGRLMGYSLLWAGE